MLASLSRSGLVAGALAMSMGIGLTAVPSQVSAQSNKELKAKIEAMERQLADLKNKMLETESTAKAAAAAASAKAKNKSLLKWHLSGYAAVNFTATNADGVNDSFGFGSFNPVFHFQYGGFAMFEAEPEFTFTDDGETNIELEYAQISLFPSDYFTFVAGKLISPVGQFRERLHPAWINKVPNAPAGFGHDGIQPLSDVGIQVRGGVPVSNGMTVTYAVGVGNGPRVGDHGLELEGFVTDDNSNKAISGRIGFLPLPYLEFGGSFMFAKVRGQEADSGPVTEGDFTLWGIDAAFTKGAFDIRAEYLNGDLSSFFGLADHEDTTTSLISATEWRAWYVQVAYQLSGVTDTPIVRNFEPVIRYGEFDVVGAFAGEGEKRINLGVNYLFTPTIIGKFSYERRDFQEPGKKNESRLLFQLTYGF